MCFRFILWDVELELAKPEMDWDGDMCSFTVSVLWHLFRQI